MGFEPPLGRRIASFLRRHPDEFYLPATEVLTLAIMSAIVLLLTNTYTSPMLHSVLDAGAALAQLAECDPAGQLPDHVAAGTADSSQARFLGRQFLTTASTLVAIPSLLLNKDQVCRLVEDLEVRFLGNHDPNMHFALLTDLPDSREPSPEDDPLVDYCAQLVRELNERYAGAGCGIVPPASSPPRLQPARKGVDGLGAKARQADGLEPAAAR